MPRSQRSPGLLATMRAAHAVHQDSDSDSDDASARWAFDDSCVNPVRRAVPRAARPMRIMMTVLYIPKCHVSTHRLTFCFTHNVPGLFLSVGISRATRRQGRRFYSPGSDAAALNPDRRLIHVDSDVARAQPVTCQLPRLYPLHRTLVVMLM
jgi:hypothetical protein